MRWLVEVSRVGDSAASERYCIDAKRWQSALQEARRFRGDAGALPKLTIELLDRGYRAVDPALKVRYVVTEAPAGTPLTEGVRVPLTTYPPPGVTESQLPPALGTGGSAAPPAPASAPAAAVPSTPAPPFTSSLPPPSRPSGGPLAVQVIRQREERATSTNPIEYREMALAVKAGATRDELAQLLEARLEEVRAGLEDDHKRYVQLAVFDHVFVKRPVRPPLATLVWKDWRGDPVLQFPGFGEEKRIASDPPTSPALSTRAPSWMGASASVSAAPLGPLPANLGGTSAPPPRTALSAGAPLAPSAAPGGFGPSGAPRPASLVPARVVSVGPSAAPAAAADAPKAASGSAAPTDPAPPGMLRTTLASAQPPLLPLGDAREAVATLPAEAPSVPVAASAPPDFARSAESASVTEPAPSSEPRSDPALPLTRRSDPASARKSDPLRVRRSDPALAPSSRPGTARRRTASEDLIGDLFESIHELAFLVDLVSGADFVVRAVYDVIPCEAIIVHAFDLGRREFVVIRARGPHARNALLHRTPDADPLMREIMRRRSLVSNSASPIRSGAFEKLGMTPQMVLCAPVRQGGRYLGLIELANPLGGTPFHESEASALEYVCEQFAEFVAARPIVLDEDVVLGR
jgi:hypothetical protein